MNKIDIMYQRDAVIKKMEALTVSEFMSDKDVFKFTEFEDEIKALDMKLRKVELTEKQNMKDSVDSVVYGNERDVEGDFSNWMNQIASGNSPDKFHLSSEDMGLQFAIPFLSTTQTALNPKNVGPMDFGTSEPLAFMQELGINFIPIESGSLTLPYEVGHTSGDFNEDVSASKRDFSPNYIELSPRRVQTSSKFTLESMAKMQSTSHVVFLNILKDAIWRKVLKNIFENLNSDAPERKTTVESGSGLSYGDFLNMEASLGSISQNNKFVLGSRVNTYVKSKSRLGSEDPAMLDENGIGEISTFATADVSTDVVYLGDWSKMAVGIWGNGIDLVVDNFSEIGQGRVIITAILLQDSGNVNANRFVFLHEASVGL